MTSMGKGKYSDEATCTQIFFNLRKELGNERSIDTRAVKRRPFKAVSCWGGGGGFWGSDIYRRKRDSLVRSCREASNICEREKRGTENSSKRRVHCSGDNQATRLHIVLKGFRKAGNTVHEKKGGATKRRE